MTRLPMVLVLALLSTAAAAAERVALLPFELINTSLEPTRPDETARLEGLNAIAAKRLGEAGYAIVDPAPVADQLAAISSLRGCNGCELALGRDLGADYVAVGWVQKVSNLILNINLRSVPWRLAGPSPPAPSTSAATPTNRGGAAFSICSTTGSCRASDSVARRGRRTTGSVAKGAVQVQGRVEPDHRCTALQPLQRSSTRHRPA